MRVRGAIKEGLLQGVPEQPIPDRKRINDLLL
jgi:hypothetical protein